MVCRGSFLRCTELPGARPAVTCKPMSIQQRTALVSVAIAAGLATLKLLVGLLLVRTGDPKADAVAALLVAALALFSAGRLMRRNVEVLMDRAPLPGAQQTAREAIASVQGAVSLRRLRMREAGGRHFADVIITVPASSDVEYGHTVRARSSAPSSRRCPAAT